MVKFEIESIEDEGSTFYVNASFLIHEKTNRVKFQFSKKDLKNDVWKEKLSDRIEKEIDGASTPLNINVKTNKELDSSEFKKKSIPKI